MTRRHDVLRRFFPKRVIKVIAKRDLQAPLDWTKPTRLDMEINRVFVYWKTTRAELRCPMPNGLPMRWVG